MGGLTQGKVDSINEAGEYRDGNGLMLAVSKTGAKSWILRTRWNGKRPEIGLGSASQVKLSEARRRVADILAKKREGIDPRLAERVISKGVTVPTFDEIAEQLIEAQSVGWSNPKQRAQWESSLKTYASPVIGDMPVHLITNDHLEQILRPIWTTKTETASRVRARTEKVLALAIVKGHRDHPNPAVWNNNLEFLFAPKAKVVRVKHHGALPYDDLPNFMGNLRAKQSLSRYLLEFQILTTARSGEVIAATWDEIDGDVWTVPPERMKNRKQHRVPLVPRVLEILEALPRFNEYLFPGRGGHTSNNTARRLLQHTMGYQDATPHGFRSTFKDWAVETTDWPGEISEAQLSHTIRNQAQAAYERGEKLAKRRELLLEWEVYCAG